MEIKKTQTSDLQNKKGLFFEIGLVVALIFTLVAFNWVSADIEHSPMLKRGQTVIEEEVFPITTHEPPPPMEIPVLAASELIDVLENDMDIIENDVETRISYNFSSEENLKLGVELMERLRREITMKEDSVLEVEDLFRRGPDVDPADIIYEDLFVDEKPTFQGGDSNLFTKWVKSKINYPTVAADNAEQGTVILSFIVGTDGKVYNVKVLRSIAPLLDQEAVRIVSMSPTWNPGRQNGKIVRVSYLFPVKFQLQ